MRNTEGYPANIHMELFTFLITYAQIQMHTNKHVETHGWTRRNTLSFLCIKRRDLGDECEIREEHPEDDRLEPRSEKNDTGRS